MTAPGIRQGDVLVEPECDPAQARLLEEVTE